MKFAICQELFEGWDWPRQCEFIAETGYTGVEVAPFTLAPRIDQVSDTQLEDMRAVAERHGLQIIGLHWLLAKTEGLHLTTRDANTRAATADYLMALAKACALLGGDVLVFGSPAQRNVAEDMTQTEAVDNAVEVFARIMPTLEELNVQLCMEPLTTKETNFINTCQEARELIDRVGSSHFVLHQDVKAMLGAETQPLPAVIKQFRDVTRHFHANDSNLLGPGMGDTDFVPLFEALLETEYAGWVSVEVFDYAPGAETIAEVSLQSMRAALATAQANRSR